MTLSAHHVSWSRGGALVVDDISVAPTTGQTIGLLGPNGSGKSSLLRLLAGAARPDLGTVTLDRTDLHSMGQRSLARRVAMVSQHAHTDIDITVYDVVRLGRIPHRDLFGRDDDEHDAIDQALAATGLACHAHRKWHTLSGGERQRVQIARALAQQPTELLLDEPTNHLDVAHQLDILELITRLPITSIVALHDLNLAAMFCDHVLVLDHGRVAAHGTPAGTLTVELIEDVYGVRTDVVLEDGVPTVRLRRPGTPRATVARPSASRASVTAGTAQP
ncbi:ABC transporter ATP-binding protein (plasmid) [Rhodococcus pyridinivorans]|uniref:ABC transporter ATP-binding protein n=1 Tax=Rhodococcus pyridinivorans TaxID=103816 RepID=UPI00200A0552|nr:ABC transporter ATP-binding protein [Rhodococcus pyridinivorans]UPW06915.1 ABC transporter ATP-binding protein [Rhodococcus pyridinivorans]